MASRGDSFNRPSKLLQKEEVEAMRIFEEESFEAMVKYVFNIIESYVLTKVICMDLLFDFSGVFMRIKDERKMNSSYAMFMHRYSKDEFKKKWKVWRANKNGRK